MCHTTKRNEQLSSLKSRQFTLTDTLFPEIVQEPNKFTESFFPNFPKKTSNPVDFIISEEEKDEEWGVKYPCVVTLYRNAYENLWDDYIVNCGDDNDVKTFCCPNFKEDVPCVKCCQYQPLNNECMDLPTKISTAERKLQKTIEQRKATWKQIWTRGK